MKKGKVFTNLVGNKKDITIGFISKAATEGVYIDSPLNRKLGRVGMSYKKYSERIKNAEESVNTHKSVKEITFQNSVVRKSEILKTATESQIDSFIDKMGYKIDKSKSLKDKKRALVKSISNYAELKGTSSQVANDIDEILEEGMEGGFEEKEVQKDKVLESTKTLKGLSSKQVDTIIKYAGFKINSNLDVDIKKKELINKYKESAELKGSNKEIAEQIDELIEDSMLDM